MSASTTIVDNEDNKEEEQVEILLPEDILDSIFAKLSLKELHRAAGVCTIWHCVANRVILRRNEIQGLILPIDDKSDSEEEYDDYEDEKIIKYSNSWHISDSLSAVPRILLLFWDGTHRRSSDPSEDFYFHYCRQIYSTVIVFDVLGTTQDNTEIVARSNLGIGISVPSTFKLEVNFFYQSIHDYDPHKMNRNELNEILDKAESDLSIIEDEHNCFIYFESSYFERIDNYYGKSKTFTNELFERFRTRCKPGTYSLFGGYTECTTTGKNDWAKCFILKISGPAMHSWSIVIQENYSKNESEKRLIKFKEGIKLKTHSIALAMVSSSVQEPYHVRLMKTESFRKIFPNVTLFGIYNENFQFGVDSTSSDPTQKFEHRNATVYLIITTD